MNKTIKAQLRILIIGVVLLFLIWLFTSCRPQYIPVESIKTEWRDKYIRDSIYVKDSIRIYQRGDTVFQDRFVKVYKDKQVRDSIFINDTIRVPVIVPSEPIYIYVDKHDSWLDKAQKYIARFGLVLLALYIGIKYRSKIFKLIRRWVLKV